MSGCFLSVEPVEFSLKFLVDSNGRNDEMLIVDAEAPRKRSPTRPECSGLVATSASATTPVATA
jgi:hypothetical protein